MSTVINSVWAGLEKTLQSRCDYGLEFSDVWSRCIDDAGDTNGAHWLGMEWCACVWLRCVTRGNEKKKTSDELVINREKADAAVVIFFLFLVQKWVSCIRAGRKPFETFESSMLISPSYLRSRQHWQSESRWISTGSSSLQHTLTLKGPLLEELHFSDVKTRHVAYTSDDVQPSRGCKSAGATFQV